MHMWSEQEVAEKIMEVPSADVMWDWLNQVADAVCRELGEKIELLQSSIDSLDNRLDVLEQRIENRFDEIERRLEE